MNYLENMGENLELLDLVKKCNVTTYSLRSIRDKNTAIKNLKGLRVELLRVSPSYMRENPCELVKTEVLNHAEAVETINLLGEEDTLNLEEMILLGSFFSEHIPYDPKLLADCVKAVGVREKSKYMRIYYDLLANGKKNLFNSVLRFPRLAAAILQECDSSNEGGFERNLEQFYILDDLADSWDVNRESERIQTFIKILNCPGAMEIYVQAGKYAKSVFLPEARDYSTAAEIVGKTMALLAEKLSKLDPNVMIQSDVYKRYFENASYIKFDQKLLSGYLKNLTDMEPYDAGNYGQQVENVLLIAKATIYGLLDEVKYKDLHKEIGYAITPEQENTWKENITLVDGKVKTGEYTDFVSCMNIGVLPERTCMNYRDGAYNECLLSTFDANKKVIYVTEEDEIIGRAILRLTKLSDEGDKNLHFEDVAEDTPENKENLVVFLERCYKNGFSGKKAAMIYRKLYDLAKRKAELLGAGLVLADDYKTVAELNGLAKKCSYIYVSESKNGKQYLDSLGGNCESGGYYVRGNFFFAS